MLTPPPPLMNYVLLLCESVCLICKNTHKHMQLNYVGDEPVGPAAGPRVLPAQQIQGQRSQSKSNNSHIKL